jgi:hypothetical protein
MKRLATFLAAAFPHLAGAHPCPYDWNIEFTKATEIKGTSVLDFAEKFNQAVNKETHGRIQKAILVDWQPDTFKQVPEGSHFAGQMDELIHRYTTLMAPLIEKGIPAYGTVPIAIQFPAKFPVACLLDAELAKGSINYEETAKGLIVTRSRHALECRAYRLGEKFFQAVADDQREGRIPAKTDAAAYDFARFSGMTWSFTKPDPADSSGWSEVSFLKAVTLYLPKEKVVLAIETREKHEEMAKNLVERGFLPGQ